MIRLSLGHYWFSSNLNTLLIHNLTILFNLINFAKQKMKKSTSSSSTDSKNHLLDEEIKFSESKKRKRIKVDPPLPDLEAFHSGKRLKTNIPIDEETIFMKK